MSESKCKPIIELHVLEGMDAQLLGCLTVFLQIVDEKGSVGIDIRLFDDLLIDTGIRLCQMHSLREEALLEIII